MFDNILLRIPDHFFVGSSYLFHKGVHSHTGDVVVEHPYPSVHDQLRCLYVTLRQDGQDYNREERHNGA